jgi:putative sigma-54 modulation protein
MIMKVQVHAIHFSADRKLLDSIQAKLNKLDTFYDRITGGEVFLKLARGEGKMREKLLEIKIVVPGAILFVKETARSFEEALDLALNALAEQIKRFKSKVNQVKTDKLSLRLE